MTLLQHPLLPLILSLFFLLSCVHLPPAGRLVGDKLRPCPPQPNCICSETGQFENNQIAPISFTGDPQKALQQLHDIAVNMGGSVKKKENDYICIVFSSKIFRFKDDLELRLDDASRQIHIRSGARIGYSDFGVNSRRVNRLLQRFEEF